ncbi:translation initiation factor IF-2-like [Nilaparvata lugens]|uniref:translation initiation factor IF-2-like n=1 Tax=Nilaparvata lugens TaxID=108931 RepID=UPI00193DA66D|nr:translation initiation factor IF-2-like [Nilaparvata lugens]
MADEYGSSSSSEDSFNEEAWIANQRSLLRHRCLQHLEREQCLHAPPIMRVHPLQLEELPPAEPIIIDDWEVPVLNQEQPAIQIPQEVADVDVAADFQNFLDNFFNDQPQPAAQPSPPPSPPPPSPIPQEVVDVEVVQDFLDNFFNEQPQPAAQPSPPPSPEPSPQPSPPPPSPPANQQPPPPSPHAADAADDDGEFEMYNAMAAGPPIEGPPQGRGAGRGRPAIALRAARRQQLVASVEDDLYHALPRNVMGDNKDRDKRIFMQFGLNRVEPNALIDRKAEMSYIPRQESWGNIVMDHRDEMTEYERQAMIHAPATNTSGSSESDVEKLVPPPIDMVVEEPTQSLTITEVVSQSQDPRPGLSRNKDPVLCHRVSTPGKRKWAGKPRMKVQFPDGRCKYVPGVS